MTSTPSIAGRAVLALVLMVGFYLLAFAVSFGLLYIPYAEMAYAHQLHLKLALVCLIGALAILWSVLPRFDKFAAPGPSLTPEKHPRLFNDLEGVAKATGQAMPAEVYLAPDVNAWVSQRGGLMGFGSRRVMGLGLPLMRMLTRSQFHAVLAHEFGHYHGGDTRLGPWIYKTRNTIGRTLASLGGKGGQRSILQLPFLWYGKMFLRVTHAVSRRQEFVADELAARTIGSKPLIDGLRTVHGVAPAFNAYWFNECAPVLNAGFRPPLVEGFEKFVQAGKIAEIIHKQLDEELKTGKADPYDTHPPLKDRIEAVSSLPAGEVAGDDPPALSLLEDVPALENEILAAVGGAEKTATLKPIRWDEVCSRVYMPQWLALVKANAAVLGGITPESLPRLAAEAKAFGGRLVGPSGEKTGDEHAESMAGGVIGAALAVLLANRGGKLDATPGREITVASESEEIEPFNVIKSLATAKITPETWQRQCAALGIQGADLGAVPTEKT
jgi:heat shock protein HtpX